MAYEVDVAFPAETRTAWATGTARCEAAAGPPVSAGTGFGQRDMQWRVKDGDAAEALVIALRRTGVPFTYVTVRSAEEG